MIRPHWDPWVGGSLPHQHQRPKLTPQQRDEIARRRGAGERAYDLAAEYGVSRRTIQDCGKQQ